MTGIFITTSYRADMRPLANQGIFATDRYHQLTTLLARVNPRAAALLAEPVPSTSGTREAIAWYAHVPQEHTDAAPTPVRVDSLPEAEQQRVTAEIQSLMGTIEEQARQALTGESHSPLVGEILRLAVQHPAADDFWLVGDQPVLINWGFAAGAANAMPVDLKKASAAPIAAPAPPVPAAVPVVPPAPEPAPQRGFGWGWLFPLLLLLLLAWLLLSLFGITPWPAACTRLPLPDSCTPKIPGLEDALRKQQDLWTEYYTLRKRLQDHALLCKPKQEEPVVPQPVKKPEPVQESEPVREPEALTMPQTPPASEPPALSMPEPEPEPQPAPKPEPKPEPKPKPKPEPKPKPKKDDPLRIPDDAAKTNDMSFLEGCWRSETDLFNNRTGEKIVAEYCFNKNGSGRRLIRERDGSVCNGNVRARFDGAGRLLIDSASAPCPGGSQYVPQQVQCTGNDRSTDCRGQEQGGKKNTWKAKFYRK